jgi:hypothetical protein
VSALITAGQTQEAAALDALATGQTAASAAQATSVSALSALVAALTSNVAALQTNVTTTLAALQVAVTRRTPGTTTPGSPPGSPSVVTPPEGTPVFKTATLLIGGYSVATFGTVQAAALKNTVARVTRVSAGSIKIKSVTAKAASAGRRLLDDAGVDVVLSIESTVGAAATALGSSLAALTADVLRTGGLLSCTALNVVPDADLAIDTSVEATLPISQPEVESVMAATASAADDEDKRLELLAILLLLLVLPLGAAVWYWRARALAAAAATNAAASAKLAEGLSSGSLAA